MSATNDPTVFVQGSTYRFYHHGKSGTSLSPPESPRTFLGRLSFEDSKNLCDAAVARSPIVAGAFWIHNDGAVDIITFARQTDERCSDYSCFCLPEIIREGHKWELVRS